MPKYSVEHLPENPNDGGHGLINIIMDGSPWTTPCPISWAGREPCWVTHLDFYLEFHRLDAVGLLKESLGFGRGPGELNAPMRERHHGPATTSQPIP